MICVCISLSGALKHWQFGRAFLAQWLKSITLQVRWAHKPGAIHPANCIGEEHGSFGRAEPKAQQPNRVISRSENGVSGTFCDGSLLLVLRDAVWFCALGHGNGTCVRQTHSSENRHNYQQLILALPQDTVRNCLERGLGSLIYPQLPFRYHQKTKKILSFFPRP